MCDSDPGFDIAGTIETDLRTLTHIWRGDVGWSPALLDGSVAVTGPTDIRHAIPSWIGQSSLARGSPARPENYLWYCGVTPFISGRSAVRRRVAGIAR